MSVTSRLMSAAWVAACLLAPLPGAAQPSGPTPAGEAMALTASRAADGAIELTWRLAPGVYLYRDKIAATSGGRAAPVSTPPARVKDDPTYGEVEIYDADVTARVESKDLDRSLPLQVTYQGCAERGVCYPPVTEAVDLATLDVSGVAAGAPAQDASPTGFERFDPTPDRTAADERLATAHPAGPDLGGSLAAVLATFFGLGLLLSLTPCVYPMIPILVGVLARSGEVLTARRGFALSAVYALAMAAAYGLLGVAAAWSGQNLQVALQTPAALLLASAIFAALALSMFDLVRIEVPSAIAVRLHGLSAVGRGTLPGAASLGFVSALIVGPCVTPPLAAALLYVAKTGDAARGSAALFALGLGMGAPLVAVGLFGAKILPKAGPWLEAVKRGFGVVFLAIAIMLASRVAPPALSLALWALFAIGIGVFLGAFDPVSETGAARRMAKAAGVAAVVYGATLIVGAASGGDDALRPLARIAAAGPPAERPERATTVTRAADLASALLTDLVSGRPSLVEVTADWCATCAENAKALAAPEIRARLGVFDVVTLDVTANDADARAAMARLDVVGPPTMLIYDADGAERPELRTTGAVDAESLAETLRRAGGFPKR